MRMWVKGNNFVFLKVEEKDYKRWRQTLKGNEKKIYLLKYLITWNEWEGSLLLNCYNGLLL